MNDEDRDALRALSAEVPRTKQAHADAVRARDQFATKLYDQGAEPSELQRETGIRSRSHLFGLFHRYGSKRVRESGGPYRVAALKRWRGDRS